MAYDLPDSLSTQELFRYWYLSARNHYSVRDRTVLPYVRPCQLCRKVVIKAYYQEAVQRGVKLIFLGMNERTHLSTN